jgi:hypothetical protein
VAAKKNPHPAKRKEKNFECELRAEQKCNQLQAKADADNKTNASTKPVRRR